MISTRVRLQAALNGDRTKAAHPATPVSVEELARDAACVAAGPARSRGTRDARRGGRGGGGHEGPRCLRRARRRNDQRRDRARPRAASGARAGLACPRLRLRQPLRNRRDRGHGGLIQGGVGVEAGVWTVEDAERLGASGLGGRVTRILIEPGELQLLDSEDKAADALGLVEDIHRALDNFGLMSPRLQYGDGEVAWVLLMDTVRRDLDTRIGLEDALYGPDGERTSGNEALVRAARELGAGTD
jgi:hypothetical protein